VTRRAPREAAVVRNRFHLPETPPMRMTHLLPAPALVLAMLLLLIPLNGCQQTAKPKAKKEAEPHKTLYDRIGGEATIVAVVEDLVARAAANPSVNFTRKGTPREWQATPENVARLKKRLIQFLGTATGGPQRYEGEDMRTAHRGMQIRPAEFAAFVKDVRAALEQAGVKEKERKELIAIIESARGTIVEQPATRRAS
jgi:hemoglobin